MMTGRQSDWEYVWRSGTSLFLKNTLPTDVQEKNYKEILGVAGVIFLGIIPESDPGLQYVVFPNGWKKLPTHDTTTYELFDEKNRRRAFLLHFPAHRGTLPRSQMYLCGRLGIELNWLSVDKPHEAIAHATCDGRIIHTEGPVKTSHAWMTTVDVSRIQRDVHVQIFAWLDANYSRWRDPGAYWNLPLEHFLTS